MCDYLLDWDPSLKVALIDNTVIVPVPSADTVTVTQSGIEWFRENGTTGDRLLSADGEVIVHYTELPAAHSRLTQEGNHSHGTCTHPPHDCT